MTEARPSKIYKSLSLKGNQTFIIAQTDTVPSQEVFKVLSSQKVIAQGGVTATTMKGKELLSSEIISADAQAVSLDTDLTAFSNGGVIGATLAAGVDGQVKYLSKTTTGNTVTVDAGANGYATGVQNVLLTSHESGATLIYNASLSHWVIVNANAVTLS